MTFEDALSTTKAQLAIVGLPRTGKTTLAVGLADALDLPVLHTDDFKDQPWEDQANAAMLAVPARGLIEGVTVARMFRRGFRPDAVLWIMGTTGAPSDRSLRALLVRGMTEYDGRILRLPMRPTVDAALWALGQGFE
jgi:hypothetical protein